MRRSIAALALLAAGCWASHPRARDVLPPDPTPEELVRALTALRCERVLRCAGPPQANAYFDAAPDASCLAYFSYLEDPALERSARRGLLRVDAAAARDCLETLSTSCTFDGDERCDRALTGTLALGAACEGALECEPGLFCDQAARCGAGTCRRASIAGEACGDGLAPCATGHRCAEGTCHPIVREARAEREPCGGELDPSGSWLSGGCGPELYCVRECRAYPPEGAPCTDGSFPLCAASLSCVGGTCRRIEVATEAGAPCDDVLRHCDRLHRLACVEGACAPVGGPGGRCEAIFSAFDCDPGDGCVEGVCRPRRADGTPCVANEECASDRCRRSRCEREC